MLLCPVNIRGPGYPGGVGGGGGLYGKSHIKRTGVLVVPFRGLKKRFWYLLGCLAQKVHSGSFSGAF